ncbi:unnamed protein product [Symbiodinium sp. CCMP2592]|nr:unnamed protein product [Symbiodinium sp. CCMP2592]
MGRQRSSVPASGSSEGGAITARNGHGFEQKTQRRLRVATYNIGGVTAELYDTLCHWLKTQKTADLIFLQEVHWGLGKQEGTWSIPGWSFVVSPDEAHRYSGVAVLVSHTAALPEQEWADEFVTLYADDFLLQWLLTTTSDLDFLGRCVRAIFSLLVDAGMTVNAAKSKLLFKAQGSQAKKWLKMHLVKRPDGPAIDLGTPAARLIIPKVHRFTYLGVEAWFGNFEMQTCHSRLRASAKVRHRILKVLHSSNLRLRHRTMLYQACVRSSMLFGQHAVGVTHAVLRKLESSDARNLRALAKSPAHLWHEPTADLRARLHLRSVTEVLDRLLLGRCRKCTYAASITWFTKQQTVLRTDQCLTQPQALQVIDPSKQVACEICGQYFATKKQVKQHCTRKHGVVTVASQAVHAHWRSHMIDGMPQCKHCRRSFTRMEGFRKHIKSGCPAMSGRDSVQNTLCAGEVPEGGAGPLGHSCRASPTHDVVESDVPLIQDAAFKHQLSRGWKQVLRTPRFCKSLRTHCVICHQWVSMTGPGCKQHIRLSHANAWAHKAAAADRCTGFGLPMVSPCAFCDLPVKDARAHIPRCSALFQASLAEILARKDLPRHDGHGPGPRPRSPEPASGSLGRGQGPTDGGRDEKDAEEPKPKFQRPSHKGYQGKGWQDKETGQTGQPSQGQSQKWWNQPKWNSKDMVTATAEPEEATQQLLRKLVKVVSRHEEEMSRIRVDTSFMLFVDSQQEGIIGLLKATADRPDACYGSGRAALQMVNTSGRQQDASVFLQHFMQIAQPSPLMLPILLDVPGELISLPIFTGGEGSLSLCDTLCTPTGCELELPPHVYYDQLEEALLLTALRNIASGCEVSVPPSLSLAAVNDILDMAKHILPTPAYQQLVDYSEMLGEHVAGRISAAFPHPLTEGAASDAEAEKVAFHYLRMGTGSLWNAVRHVISLLPFEMVQRRHQREGQRQFACGAYGHRSSVGLYRHTVPYQSAILLINTSLCSICPSHTWSTVVITLGNVAELHVDRQNAPQRALVLGISHFEGGRLWLQNLGAMFQSQSGAGPMQTAATGTFYDLSARAYLVPTHCRLHATEPGFLGNRFVVIAYLVGQHASLSQVHMTALSDMGFCLPTYRNAGPDVGIAADATLEIEVVD